MVPDQTGKRAGRPKFKKKGEMRSFGFSRINHPKAACFLEGSILRIPRFGEIPVIVHRPLPDGFTPKTASIVKKADGWYVSISLEDDSVPSPRPMNEVQTAIGVDVGLKEFLTTSDGNTVPVQRVYRKAQACLARQQRSLARKKLGSKNAKKQTEKVAKIHQRIARQREDFQYKTAYNLVINYDLIAVENLQIRNLARNSKLAKSIYDVAWGRFISILEAVAVKCGVWVVKVAPHGTSVECSGCGHKVPKTLSIRLHQCSNCGLQIDRDENAAKNILDRALNAVGLMVSACGGLEVAHPKKQEAPSAKRRSPRYTRKS